MRTATIPLNLVDKVAKQGAAEMEAQHIYEKVVDLLAGRANPEEYEPAYSGAYETKRDERLPFLGQTLEITHDAITIGIHDSERTSATRSAKPQEYMTKALDIVETAFEKAGWEVDVKVTPAQYVDQDGRLREHTDGSVNWQIVLVGKR